MNAFHPDLRVGRFIPRLSVGPRLTALTRRRATRLTPAPADLVVEDLAVPGVDGAPPVTVRSYRPRSLRDRTAPAFLSIHGGGMVLGDHLASERSNIAMARTLGITVVSPDYRLAPEHRAPAAVEDAYSVLTWMAATGHERGIDADRIAVGGDSAGGGIAAGLALLAHDRAQVRPVLQVLTYPMLDDRTVLRTDLDTSGVRVWTPRSNRFGWSAYLGPDSIGAPEVSDYAAPARREDLSGLPPAWIGVGTLDLFHDEDVTYARRLDEAGVDCDLLVVPGAFHGFDVLFGRTGVARQFFTAKAEALSGALFV